MTRVAVALVHYPCLDRNGAIFTTSITNLDVHDIARAGRTYGVQAFYVVTPVAAQQAMAREIARYWGDEGKERNPDRTTALEIVRVVASVEEAVADETAAVGRSPCVVATSARPVGTTAAADLRARLPMLSSALLLFGTGHGLAAHLVDGADVVLAPLGSPSGYNHLSVRSACAIYLDRLLG